MQIHVPDKTYTISELAKEFGITTRTIRFYEEKGLIAPLREGQKRVYQPADRVRIKLILRGKRIGLSLAESMEIIDMYSPDRSDNEQLEKLLGRVREQRDALLRQREDLDATLRELDEVEALCEKARSTGTDKNH